MGRVRGVELAAANAADLALRLVRAEGRVDVTEPVEHIDDRRLVAGVADGDDDRHAHQVLDAVHQTLFAFSSADCSDCMNASLVSDAPEIIWMFGLNCACSTSCVRYGSACWLMNTDRSVWFG